MGRQTAERNLKRLQRVKTWQLLIILVLAMFVSATFLRLNNIGMIQRRDAVLSADQAGNTERIRDRLYDLQRYSAGHMNANTGSFYLQESYNRERQRLMAAAQEQASGQSSNIYQEVEENVCRPRAIANGWRWQGTPDDRYTSCILTELAEYPAASEFVDTVHVNPDLYRHSFVSPLWSPDFAGFSVLFCLVIIVVIIGRLISLAILRLLLHRHYKSI